jgi:hypothetical protein
MTFTLIARGYVEVKRRRPSDADLSERDGRTKQSTRDYEHLLCSQRLFGGMPVRAAFGGILTWGVSAVFGLVRKWD